MLVNDDDVFHALIVAVDGALHASNPRAGAVDGGATGVVVGAAVVGGAVVVVGVDDALVAGWQPASITPHATTPIRDRVRMTCLRSTCPSLVGWLAVGSCALRRRRRLRTQPP